MKQAIIDNLKNLRGWRTSRKLVAFAVDDYANVRLASPIARERLIDAGLDLSGQMDRFDSMETRQDLEGLFEVLDSVRDGRDRPAIFTAYALSANPDFNAIRRNGRHYHPEPVTATFERLAAEQPQAYEGAWSLWQEGMARGLIRPQFHGREHLNVRLFEEKLNKKAPDLLANLENSSLAGFTKDSSLPDIGFSQAFAIHDDSCLDRHAGILRDGVRLFEQCFGFRSITFTPPAQKISPELYAVCVDSGIRLIHKPRYTVRKAKGAQQRRELCWTGRKHPSGHTSLVRNAVFEPGLNDKRSSEDRVIEQIRAAFRWRKPAIISSHRVNFCGHIEENNRTRSLRKLRRLLRNIVCEWPDVEFVALDDLAEMITPGAVAGPSSGNKPFVAER